jgi:hypothetical protein
MALDVASIRERGNKSGGGIESIFFKAMPG